MTEDKSKIKTHADGLQNVVSGLGTSKSKSYHNDWVLDILQNWQQLDAAYQTNWIARRIVDVPARDMTREWRRIKSEGAEEISGVEQTLCVQQVVEEAVAWARLFGGSGILMLTGQDLGRPLRINQVKKGDLKQLLVFDRWDMSPMTMNTWDVLAPNYLMPEFYVIKGGSQLIHWSHVVRFNGERLPRRWMEQTQGFGDSVLRKALQDIEEMVAAKGGIAELMTEANIDVITRTGLTDELASDQDAEIVKRYELFSMLKSVFNMALLDGDEKLERQTLNLSGVSSIMEQFLTWIAGCAGIPVTKLFGTSAKGMNATGEGDLTNYNDDIRSQQVSTVGKPMALLDEVLVRSALGNMPANFDYVWNPLTQSNEVEESQAGLIRAQTNRIYLEDGVVMTSQVQRNLQSNEEYQFDDDQIEEREELEDTNMFEELPDLTAREDDNFIDSYQALSDGGMSHDDIMKRL